MSLIVPILSVGALTYLFAILDRTIAKSGYQKPYFAVHFLHNTALVAATASDVLVSFTDFGNLAAYPITWPAVYLCYALHAYHCLLYWRAFHYDDWLHHGLMIGVALPLGCSVSAGPLMGMNLFFTTGLPGGVSYALLFAEKNGMITRATSRRWNARINLWLRSPGCLANATMVLASVLSTTSGEVTPWQMFVAVAVSMLTAWNGQYFMEQVVSANTVTAVSEQLSAINTSGAGRANAHSMDRPPNRGDANEGAPRGQSLSPIVAAATAGAAGVLPPL
jgi:hypothetical protein